ncbi:MAG: hypothetical protein PHN49_00065, partial [Candidatus Omnitrophica bacterium]|nr:hypothetical protein [Candidatus Omnitrophota bacterium]
MPEERLSHSPKAFPVSSDTLADLSLPPDLGVLDEIYASDSSRKHKEKPTAEFESPQTIVLIQDAHAIPDAQKSVCAVIEYLESEYGIDLVALEGTSGKLDPTLLRTFPDTKLLKQVIQNYLERGELSGAAAAAFLSGKTAAFHGVEDQELYEKTIDDFLAALKTQKRFLAQLDTLQKELDQIKKDVYAPRLLELDRKFEVLSEKTDGIPDYLKYIDRFAGKENSSEFQKNYPHLSAVLEEFRKNPRADERALNHGIEKLSRTLDRSLKDAREISEFNGKRQSYETEQISREAFAQYLLELSQKKELPVDLSKPLREATERYRFLGRMKGQIFFRELRAYTEHVRESLFLKDDERRLNDLSREYRILRKLAELKLSREEWNELERIQTQGSSLPAFFVAGPKTQDLGKGDKQNNTIGQFGNKLNSLFETIRSDYVSYLEFYQAARRRDTVLTGNLVALMNENKREVAVLVTGGFHTDGIKQMLKEQGLSYILISPAIGQLPSKDRYTDLMQGRVSWSDYYEVQKGRINLYDAFHKATVERLIKANDLGGNGNLTGKLLRDWRDGVIRDLAVKGKTEDARQYTRFVDWAAKKSVDPGQLEALKKQWLEKVNRFVGGLRALRTENKLTVDNVMRLANQPTATPCATIPNGTMPADWYVTEAEALRLAQAIEKTAVITGSPIALDELTRSEMRAANLSELLNAVEPLVPSLFLRRRSDVNDIMSRAMSVMESQGDFEPLPARQQRLFVRKCRGIIQDILVENLGEKAVIAFFNADAESGHAHFMEAVNHFRTYDSEGQNFEDFINLDFFDLEALRQFVSTHPADAADLLGSVCTGTSAQEIRRVYGAFPQLFTPRMLGEQSFTETAELFVRQIRQRLQRGDEADAEWEELIDRQISDENILRTVLWLSNGFSTPTLGLDRLRRDFDKSPLSFMAALSLVLNMQDPPQAGSAETQISNRNAISLGILIFSGERNPWYKTMAFLRFLEQNGENLSETLPQSALVDMAHRHRAAFQATHDSETGIDMRSETRRDAIADRLSGTHYPARAETRQQKTDDIVDPRWQMLEKHGYRPVSRNVPNLGDKGLIGIRYDSVLSPDAIEELLIHDPVLMELSDMTHPPVYLLAPYINLPSNEGQIRRLTPIRDRVAILQGVVPGMHNFTTTADPNFYHYNGTNIPAKVLPYPYADPETLGIVSEYDDVWGPSVESKTRLRKARQQLFSAIRGAYPERYRPSLESHRLALDQLTAKVIPESFMAMHYTSKYGSPRALTVFLNALWEGKRIRYEHLRDRPIVVFTFLQRGLVYDDIRGVLHNCHDEMFSVLEGNNPELKAQVQLIDLHPDHFQFPDHIAGDKIIVINLPSQPSRLFNTMHFLSDTAVVAGDIGMNNALIFSLMRKAGTAFVAPHLYSQVSLESQFHERLREGPATSKDIVTLYERTLSKYLLIQDPDFHTANPQKYLSDLTDELAAVFGRLDRGIEYRDMFANLVVAERSMFNYVAAMVRELDHGRSLDDVLHRGVGVVAGLEPKEQISMDHYRLLITMTQAITGFGDARRVGSFSEVF